jgi:hypothetical protein
MSFDPISLGVNLGISLISASITARANKLKGIHQFQRPTASESRKLPYIAGTVLHKSANLVWWGDFKTSSINLDLPGPSWVWGPIAIALQALPFGYRYYIGMSFALCHNNDAQIDLEEVRCGGKTVWTGSEDGGIFTVSAPGVFKNEGGLYATCEFAPGEGSAQARNTYLNARVGNTPSFQTTAMLHWHGPSVGAAALGKIKYSGYVSRSAYIKPFAFRINRKPAGNIGLVLNQSVNTTDANPANVIYDILTSDTFGAGIPAAQIHTASFIASSFTLKDDDIGASFIWDTDDELSEVLQGLCDLGDLALYTDPSDGLIHLDCIREYDGDLEDLDLFDETNSVVVRYGSRPPEKVATEVKIKYTDIAAGFTEKTAEWRSIAMRRLGDNREPLTIRHLGISNAAQAEKIASRDGLAFALPLKEIILRTTRYGWDKVPGEPVRFSWADYGVSEMVCRVARVDRGTARDGVCEVTLVEDRFRYGQSVFGETAVSGFTEPRVDVPVDSSVQNVLGIVTVLPGSPATGDAYLLSSTHATYPNGLAVWNGTEWVYRESTDLLNTTVYNTADATWHYHNGAEWGVYRTTAYQKVQDEGILLTARDTLNFIGPGVQAVDNPTSARTDVRITSSGGTVTGSLAPAIATAVASAADAHNTTGTWETVNTMSVTVSPDAVASLHCAFTFNLSAALASSFGLRFLLDGATASETWLLKDSGTVHSTLTGVMSGAHTVVVQWHDQGSGLTTTFDSRQVSVLVGQGAASDALVDASSIIAAQVFDTSEAAGTGIDELAIEIFG